MCFMLVASFTLLLFAYKMDVKNMKEASLVERLLIYGLIDNSRQQEIPCVAKIFWLFAVMR